MGHVLHRSDRLPNTSYKRSKWPDVSWKKSNVTQNITHTYSRCLTHGGNLFLRQCKERNQCLGILYILFLNSKYMFLISNFNFQFNWELEETPPGWIRIVELVGTVSSGKRIRILNMKTFGLNRCVIPYALFHSVNIFIMTAWYREACRNPFYQQVCPNFCVCSRVYVRTL